MLVNGTDLLFMENIEANYIKEFDATIIAKNMDDKGRNYVVLDRSAFYPKGGGQPTDQGCIRWKSVDSGQEMQLKVLHVSKKAEIRHYVEDSPFLTEIESGMKVKGVLDWERRYAYMKMHTAQHLVSAIVYNIYQASTVGNQIYADRSRVDFSPLAHEDVDSEDIEKQCNDIIRTNPQVKVFFEKRSVIEASGDADRCNIHLIPKSIQELRIVKIKEVELCPCAGTHVRNTGEIGGISITNLRSKGKGRVRITYELVRDHLISKVGSLFPAKEE